MTEQRQKIRIHQFRFEQGKNRGKTGEKIFAILNPLAIQCLKDYLRTHHEPKLFDLTDDAVNKRFKSLAQEAGLVTVGRIRSHAIRAWLISELTVLGFSEFEVKLLTGKSIGYSDLTYLEGLKRQILDKYKKVYPKINLSGNGNGNNVSKLREVIMHLESELADKTEEITELRRATKETYEELLQLRAEINFLYDKKESK